MLILTIIIFDLKWVNTDHYPVSEIHINLLKISSSKNFATFALNLHCKKFKMPIFRLNSNFKSRLNENEMNKWSIN